MKVGVVGFSGVGRSTVFSALTGQDVSTHSPGKGALAVVEVIDRRLDHLRDVYEPKKFTRARFDVEDCPALPKADARGRAETVVTLREPEALLLVIGCFEQARMLLEGSLQDPEKQFEAFRDELALLDLEAAERRLARVRERLGKGGGDRAALAREESIVEDIYQKLEAGSGDLAGDRDKERLRILGELRLFAQKPVVPVFNVDEGTDLNGAEADALCALANQAAVLCAPVEQEIAQIEDDEERAGFLGEYGLEAPASERLTRLAYDALDLISFFTVGRDEVRAWPIVRGSDAVTAAGKIHTDLARGFIRAEVTPYASVSEATDERSYKEAAASELKGKEYVVEDGDVLNIRFSV